MKDLYSILNVTKESNDSEIKKSYKKLAFKYHPDKNKDPSAAPIFSEISEAYEILTNKEKKKIYDQFGYEAVTDNFEGSISPIDLFQSLFNVDFTNPVMGGNIFMFSDLSSGPFPPGLNIKQTMKYSLNLTLKELYKGTKKEFTIHHRGKDNKMKKTNYIINIKKGSKNGDNIIVKEGGNYISELNIIEDLIIQIIELKHPKYQRKGNDLFIEENISLCEALCGFNLFIQHLDGPLNIEIKEIIKPNQMYQVFEKGMPIKFEDNSLTEENKNIKYGNLIIHLIIDFPDELTDKYKDYLKKILNYTEREKKEGNIVQGFYYKNKEDIVKNIINKKDDDGLGCIQQ